MQTINYIQLKSKKFAGHSSGLQMAGGCSEHVTKSLDASVLTRVPALWEIAELTGSTPLFRVPSDAGCGEIFAKAEWLNYGGTVKARTAVGMLHDTIAKRPECRPNDLRIRTYSGGSMHITIAGMCQALGMACRIDSGTFLMPSQVARIRALGADLVLHDKDFGFWPMVEKARDLASSEDPEATFLFQHEHPANLRMHETTTGPEIAEQLLSTPGGPRYPDAWIAAIGTGGSLIGVGKSLRMLNPEIKIYGMTPSEQPFGTPDKPSGLATFAGSGGMGLSRRQPIVAAHEQLVSGHFTMAFRESLLEARLFAKLTGVRIGSSAAANWSAARHVSQQLGPGSTVVTVFPSLLTAEQWSMVSEMD